MQWNIWQMLSCSNIFYKIYSSIHHNAYTIHVHCIFTLQKQFVNFVSKNVLNITKTEAALQFLSGAIFKHHFKKLDSLLWEYLWLRLHMRIVHVHKYSRYILKNHMMLEEATNSNQLFIFQIIVINHICRKLKRTIVPIWGCI